MGTVSNIVEITYPEHFTNGYARLGHIDQFKADPVGWKFDRQDPDAAELLGWLNANTPGWQLKIHPGAIEDIEMPVGCEPVVTMQAWTIDILFAAADHREAFRGRRAAERNARDAQNAHVERRIAEAPAGIEVCDECGGHLRPKCKIETSRSAQFAFRYTLAFLACPDCGVSYHSAHPEINAINDAADDIESRVGLPRYGDPLWTENIDEERIRRRKAEPEILIELTPDSTAESLIAELDAHLAGAGRPQRAPRPILRRIETPSIVDSNLRDVEGTD